ncbi:macro domain-containing protein [Secundilactobacillus muriivasis]
MLIYVKTNLFDSSAQVIVNTVNTVGVMGKGIALQFKKLYPEMFKEYQHYCETGELTVGKLWLYKSSNKWILNFPTKKNWRNKSKVEYIEAGLKKFVDSYQERNIESISFPQLGTGNGGLDWEQVVKPLMEKYLRHLPIPVYVHLYSGEKEIPEYRNIKEMKEWLEREPDAISLVEFKSNVSTVVENNHSDHQIIIDDEHGSDPTSDSYMTITTATGINYSISQADLADLWTRLRDQGLVVDIDLPSAVLQSRDLGFFKQLMMQLPYIKLSNVGIGEHTMQALTLKRSGLPEKADVVDNVSNF